ncbi:L,D-transpeptidase family protein [Erythrobacter donghaensis]|uniref:L,D-transpeptidase family protein n=1 Tax=Erythrobacter donghaensis TaxID=267135 RepID=UPI000A39C1D4|nr:L,D-transpeptidase family protein [Erythrobacter donghaensis]
MRGLRLAEVWVLAAALLAAACVPEVLGAEPEARRTASALPDTAALTEALPKPPPTRSVSELLQSGVVIAISLSSQQMHVFRDGAYWRSSPVSTGKRGKETPPGVFAILQKKKFHRSNLYSNAPMPFMQRLTWDGIAIHAGRLPGYPASHGCIRIPDAFARELFAITGPASTAVIVVDEALPGEADALALAQRTDALVPINPDLLKREGPLLAKAKAAPEGRLPASRTIALPGPAAIATALPLGSQTIQLAAAISPEDAATQWQALSARSAALRDMQMVVIPAMVNGKQYYRLRASAPGAHATCTALKRAGIDCFAVK